MTLESTPNKFRTERYRLRTVRLPNPAAGADVLFMADDNTVAQIMGVSFGFLTSAVAADRLVFVEHYSADNYHSQSSACPAIHVASTGIDYFFTIGINTTDWRPTGGITREPLSPDIEVTGGDRFRISARLIDAGDQFLYIDLRLREWDID